MARKAAGYTGHDIRRQGVGLGSHHAFGQFDAVLHTEHHCINTGHGQGIIQNARASVGRTFGPFERVIKNRLWIFFG